MKIVLYGLGQGLDFVEVIPFYVFEDYELCDIRMCSYELEKVK